MANYSAAFGYKFYLLPLASDEVDLAFTGITTGTGLSGASTGFLKTDTIKPAPPRHRLSAPLQKAKRPI